MGFSHLEFGLGIAILLKFAAGELDAHPKALNVA
jgi:hypothetical protein